MSSSDWLQIVLTFVGIVVGIYVSWKSFHAQQVTDFNRLQKSIGDTKDQLNTRLVHLEVSIARLVEVTGQVKDNSNVSKDISKKLDGYKDLESLKGAVDRLSYALDAAVTSIISEVRGQQRTIADSVQDSFAVQSKKAAKDILGYLQRDLDKAIPSITERDELVMKASQIIEQAMATMGKYQLVILEKQQDNALEAVAQKANEQNNVIKEEVHEVRQNAESLERTLVIFEQGAHRQVKR